MNRLHCILDITEKKLMNWKLERQKEIIKCTKKRLKKLKNKSDTEDKMRRLPHKFKSCYK